MCLRKCTPEPLFSRCWNRFFLSFLQLVPLGFDLDDLIAYANNAADQVLFIFNSSDRGCPTMTMALSRPRRTRAQHSRQRLFLYSKSPLPRPQNTYKLREHSPLTKQLNNRAPGEINGNNHDKISITILLQRQKSTRVLSITKYHLSTSTMHGKYEHEYTIQYIGVYTQYIL